MHGCGCSSVRGEQYLTTEDERALRTAEYLVAEPVDEHIGV